MEPLMIHHSNFLLCFFHFKQNLAKYFPEKKQVKHEVAFPYLFYLFSTVCMEFSQPFSLSSPSMNLILFFASLTSSFSPAFFFFSVPQPFILSLCHFMLSLLPVLNFPENLFVCDLVLPFNLFGCSTGVSFRKYAFLKMYLRVLHFCPSSPCLVLLFLILPIQYWL